MCIEIDSVCGERDGIGPVTVRVWHRIGVRLRVIMHFVQFFIFWHFVRIPDTASLIFINHIFLFFLSDIVTCPNKIFKLNLIFNVICINILFYLSFYHPFIDVYSSVVIESVIMKFAFMKCKRYEYFTVIKT